MESNLNENKQTHLLLKASQELDVFERKLINTLIDEARSGFRRTMPIKGFQCYMAEVR